MGDRRRCRHLGRRRLMLQGLAQFGVALVEFFKQPHVLDGDYRLIGESFDQRDLFVGERANFFRMKPRAPTAIPSRINGTPSMVR